MTPYDCAIRILRLRVMAANVPTLRSALLATLDGWQGGDEDTFREELYGVLENYPDPLRLLGGVEVTISDDLRHNLSSLPLHIFWAVLTS